MRPLRVFLCHASQDKPAVRELYSALKAEGWIDPWLDKAKILPGQDWRRVIEKAVEDADVVIVCLSNQSVSKEGFVQREIKYAYDIALEKPEETIFLIPLRLDDCAVPRGLRSFHWVDYFGAEKNDAYSDLLEALKLRYEQKLDLEAEEIARAQVEELLQHKIGELKHKIPVEIGKREAKKIAHETESVLMPPSSSEEGRGNGKLSKDNQKLSFLSSINNDLSVFIPQVIFSLFMLALLAWGVYIMFSSKTPKQSVDLPVATAPVSFPKDTPTFELATSTRVPFTATPQPTVPPTPAPTLGIGSTEVSTQDGMVLVYIPAGKFLMGSGNGESDEKPIHTVNLDAFWIDQTEVTNAMYAKCVSANKCDPPNNTSHYDNSKYVNHPVVYVSWNDALAYCTWADRRLPTEAQWEKAARGTDGRTYPWGNDAPTKDLLNYVQNIGDTTAVKNYPNTDSFYGTYDMAGNVWEWVNDWYDSTYYASSPESNPQGPNLLDGHYRLLRGGSWLSNNYIVRSAIRGKYVPTVTYVIVGFRCSRSP